MRYTLFIAILFSGFFPLCQLNAQGWQWGLGSRGSTGEGIAPAVDAWGNVYGAGNYGGPDTIGAVTVPSGGGGVLITKCDASGHVVWAKRAGGTQPLFIAADNSGDLYLLALYNGPSVTVGTITLTNPNPAVGAYYVAKYSPSGSVAWAINFGGPGYAIGSKGGCIAVRNNHVYILASFAKPTLNIGTYTFTNNDPSGLTTDMFLAKIDSNSNLVWVKQIGGSMEDEPTGLAVSPTEKIYLCGNFESPVIAFGTPMLTLTGPFIDLFLAKYDSSGNGVWAKDIYGVVGDFISVTSDNNEDAIVTGSYGTNITFGTITITNPGFWDYIYLVKYDSSGSVSWVKKITGDDTEGWGVGTDACENIWVCGSIDQSDTVDGHVVTAPAGFLDPMILACFDATGTYITSATSETGGDDLVGIGVDGIGNAYIGGDYYTYNTFTFGSSVIVNPTGQEGLLLAKYRYNSDTDTTYAHTDSCLSDSMVLAAPAGFSAYSWSDKSTGASLKIFDSGIYWVACTGACGMGIRIDTFYITRGTRDTTYEQTDTAICSNSTVALTGPDGYTHYTWNDGTTNKTLTADTAGSYYVIATGYCSTPTAIDSFRVSLKDANLNFSPGADTTSCGPVVLSESIPGATYLWQDGSTAGSYTAYKSGTYFVTISEQGCSFSDTISVNIPDLSQHLRDTVLCREQPILLTLQANVPPGASALWNNGSSKPEITITDTGMYWVKVTDTPCVSSDSIEVSSELCNCEIDLPNTFTPNEDGKNDLYYPLIQQGCEISNYSFAIYNRWGERVFYSEDANEKWNGTFKGINAEMGTYMYYLKYTAGINNSRHMLKGDVTLIR